MILFDYTVEVTTGPEATFQVVADPRSKLLWVPGIRRVEVNSDVPPGPGMRYLASSGIGLFEFEFQEQIVDWIENERVIYEGRSPWGHFKTCVVLEPEMGGTRLHYRMDYAFPASWLGALVYRRFFNSMAYGDKSCTAVEGSRGKRVMVGRRQ